MSALAAAERIDIVQGALNNGVLLAGVFSIGRFKFTAAIDGVAHIRVGGINGLYVFAGKARRVGAQSHCMTRSP